MQHTTIYFNNLLHQNESTQDCAKKIIEKPIKEIHLQNHLN